MEVESLECWQDYMIVKIQFFFQFLFKGMVLLLDNEIVFFILLFESNCYFVNEEFYVCQFFSFGVEC